MVSEDSDQLLSGLSPVHRLGDLSDLNEARRREVTPAGRELHTRCELLEVASLRRPEWVLPEERNDLLEQILSVVHDELGHVLAVVVVSLVDEDAPTAENVFSSSSMWVPLTPCDTTNRCETW